MQSDGDVFVGFTCNAVGITFVIISLQKYVQIFFRLFKIRVIGASQRYMTTFKLCHFCAFSWNSVAVFELNVFSPLFQGTKYISWLPAPAAAAPAAPNLPKIKLTKS